MPRALRGINHEKDPFFLAKTCDLFDWQGFSRYVGNVAGNHHARVVLDQRADAFNRIAVCAVNAVFDARVLGKGKHGARNGIVLTVADKDVIAALNMTFDGKVERGEINLFED